MKLLAVLRDDVSNDLSGRSNICFAAQQHVLRNPDSILADLFAHRAIGLRIVDSLGCQRKTNSVSRAQMSFLEDFIFIQRSIPTGGHRDSCSADLVDYGFTRCSQI